jgi:RHS repeat-associated protein
MSLLVLSQDQLRALGAAAALRARRQLADQLSGQDLKADLSPDGDTLSLTNAAGQTSIVRFADDQTTVASPTGRTHTFGHDAEGRLKTLEDPAGDRVTFEHDGPRLSGLRRPDGSRLGFEYDAAGRLSAMRYPDGAVFGFQHDDQGRVERVTDFAGHQRRYEYTDFGWPALFDLGAGRQTSFIYDQDCELEAAREPGRPDLGFRDDTADGAMIVTRGGREQRRVRASPTNDEIVHEFPDGTWTRLGFTNGRLAAAATPQATLRLEYDAEGRLLAEDLDGERVTYERDAVGGLTAIVAGATRIAFQRDADGRLIEVRDPRGRTCRLSHSPAGALTRIDYPNGVAVERTSNNLGLVAGLAVTTPSEQDLVRRSWTYDARDRVAEERAAGRATRRFAYDPNGRLLRVDSDQPDLREAYDLDDHGNAAQADGSARQYDLAEQIRSRGRETIEHDDNGCVTRCELSVGPATLRHDAASRLVEVVTPDHHVRYDYDPIGRRTGKTVTARDGTPISATHYRWAATLLLSEVTTRPGRDDEVCEYLPAPDLGVHLARRIDGRDVYIHHGRRWEALAATDAQGVVVWRTDYSAFGRPRLEIDTAPQPFRLMGQYADPETGLHYNLARYYDPGLGRFLSPDPLGYAGGSWNPYIYGDGDALNRVDPTGEFLPVLLAGAAGVGAVIGGGVEAYRQHKANPNAPLDWSKIGKEAAIGGAVGLVGAGVGVLLAPLAAAIGTGAAAVLAAGALVGGVSSAIEACADAALHGHGVSVLDLLKASGIGAAIGAVTAGMGGIFANRARRAAEAAKRAANSAENETARAANSAAAELYKDELRAAMERPAVSDPKLSSLIDQHYREGASVGSGSTAAAVRQELATGVPVGGRLHSQKAADGIRSLEKWLERNPTARASDRAAAENVKRDMENALREK